MRKAILLIGSYPPPFGGISSHIQYLAPYLVCHNYDVHIISSGIGKTVEKTDGFTIYRLSKNKKIFNIALHFIKLLRKAAKLKALGLTSSKEYLNVIGLTSIIDHIISKNKNIKLISAYHLFPEGFAGAIASEIFSIPLVVTNFGEIYSKLNFFRERLSVVNYICKKSFKILSSSQHCAKSYRLLGIRPNVEVVPYGIDIEHFSPENMTIPIHQKFGINTEDKVVLFVGRMIKDMGIDTLLDAIPRVLQAKNKIKFVIAGAKGELFESTLKLRAQYKKNVFIVPNVPFDELPLYYAISTIVTAPTPNERACMGMAIKEAMAAGKPVIGAKSGGIPEAIIDGETGILIPPKDSDALAKAILDLIEDENKIAKMRRNGRQRAEILFDKEVTNQKIYKIFQEVTG